MLNFILVLIYMGGFINSYKHAKDNELGTVAALVDMFAWPYAVGEYITKKVYEREWWVDEV